MKNPAHNRGAHLAGHSGAVVALSYYPWDPRIRRETEALAESGMDIDVFCLRETAAEPSREIVNGVTVHRLELRRHRVGKLRYLYEYAVFFLWSFFRLSLGTLRHRYAVVHIHNVPDALVFTTLVPRLFGARIILDLHDPMPELYQTIYGLPARHPLVRFMVLVERLAIAYADVVFTPNRGFSELFAARTRHGGKVHIVMNTPDETLFRLASPAAAAPASAAAPRRFRLMYHGLIAERHGLDILVRAVQLLLPAIPELQLDIYGAPNPFLDTIQALIVSLGLAASVRCHGKRPLAEIAAIIPTIDLGIVPNRRSPFTEINFPTRIFEYLALKKPVVTLNTKGVRDYFERDEIFFLDAATPAALAALIQRIHENPAATQATVERGYRVYCRHRWADERERFLAVVTRVLPAAAPAPAEPAPCPAVTDPLPSPEPINSTAKIAP